jgi:tetratricopeptide (TPR) repeat protein
MTEARKVAVILIADIVGFSRLAGTDEERTIARLRALRSDLIDPTIALHNGRLVKRTGDGAVVEFRSAVEAVRAAIEVQTGMAERNAGVPAEKRIEARVGIHLGEADAGYRLCEQALAADPNNVHALTVLSVKFLFPVALGRSADPKGDLGRADELVSRALALDPNFAGAHVVRANILRVQGRLDDAIAESERALALDPAHVDAYGTIGGAYSQLGQFEKGLEFTDKAIRLSPHDSGLIYWYADKASDYIGLGQYDQAIEWARRAVAVGPNDPSAHYVLGRAYGHLGQADKALEEYGKGIELTPEGSNVSGYYREKGERLFQPETV